MNLSPKGKFWLYCRSSMRDHPSVWVIMFV